MTPHGMLAVLDDALVRTPRGRNRIALELTAPVVLGQTGKYMGADDNGPVYGFTRSQCFILRDVILAAAREDAGQ